MAGFAAFVRDYFAYAREHHNVRRRRAAAAPPPASWAVSARACRPRPGMLLPARLSLSVRASARTVPPSFARARERARTHTHNGNISRNHKGSSECRECVAFPLSLRPEFLRPATVAYACSHTDTLRALKTALPHKRVNPSLYIRTAHMS